MNSYQTEFGTGATPRTPRATKAPPPQLWKWLISFLIPAVGATGTQATWRQFCPILYCDCDPRSTPLNQPNHLNRKTHISPGCPEGCLHIFLGT